MGEHTGITKAGAILLDPISNKNKNQRSIYRSAEFRRELLQKDREIARQRRERSRARHESRHLLKNLITVDTSKARSNIDVLRKCVRELRWKECPAGRRDQNCDIFWHGTNVTDYSDLYTGQINKFPGMGEVCGKINLFRTLDVMKSIFPNEYDFYPRTWLLPQQYHEFSNEIKAMSTEKKSKPKPTFIVKPDDGSQGEGIYLLREPKEYVLQGNKSHVVQDYLSEPLLIEKFKFDLRIYVVLRNLDPLEFYIDREGLVRFCTVSYQRPTCKNMHESYMHLTNYSLNKRSSTYNPSDKEDEGSKRTLTSVMAKLTRLGHDTSTLWEAIERVVSKTLIAMNPELKVAYQAQIPAGKPGPSCFQILGFDILLMKDLKPMLLEVNSNPSLRIDGEQEISPGVVTYLPSLKDEEIKRPLVRDTFLLVAPKEKMEILQRERRQRRYKKRWYMARERGRGDNQHKPNDEHPRADNTAEEDGMNMEVPETTATSNGPSKATSIIIVSDSDSSPNADRPRSVFDHADDRPASPPMELFKLLDKIENNALEEVVNLNTKFEESPDGNESDEQDYDSPIEEEESCLKQIYPAVYEAEYERLRLLEKVAHIFMSSLGIKGSWRIGLTGFRLFTRKCHLARKGLTSASTDILFIDFQRKWDYLNPDRTTGLCYPGFVDAFLEIARRKFYSSDRTEMVENLVRFCESNMANSSRSAPFVNKRLLGRRVQSIPLRLSYGEGRLSEDMERIRICLPDSPGGDNRKRGLYKSSRDFEPKE